MSEPLSPPNENAIEAAARVIVESYWPDSKRNEFVMDADAEIAKAAIAAYERALAVVPHPLAEDCSLCHVPFSTGACDHLLDLGDGRVVLRRSVWESLIEDRHKLRALAVVEPSAEVSRREECPFCGACWTAAVPASPPAEARPEAADLGPNAMPDRIAIDGHGYGWRVWSDQENWSMVPQNPDNEPIPEPLTWFVPESFNHRYWQKIASAAEARAEHLAAALRQLVYVCTKVEEVDPRPYGPFFVALNDARRVLADTRAENGATDG